MAKSDLSPPQQVQGPIVIEIRQYPQFGFSVERAGPEGKDRIISFYHPDGIRRDYPLEAESAKKLADAIAAPATQNELLVPTGVEVKDG